MPRYEILQYGTVTISVLYTEVCHGDGIKKESYTPAPNKIKYIYIWYTEGTHNFKLLEVIGKLESQRFVENWGELIQVGNTIVCAGSTA